MPSTIALDIDGTMTTDKHLIPDEIILYLESLEKRGWQIIFVTGRALSYALTAIQKVQFPYLLAVQNGADVLQMPEKKLLLQNYLRMDVLYALDKIYESFENDMLIYSGFEKGDFCYFRPKKCSAKFLLYLEKLKNLSASLWQEVEDFQEVEQQLFPLIKCVGSKEEMEILEKMLEEVKDVRTSVIRDPICPEYYLTLVTNKRAVKGCTVTSLMKKYQLKRPLIAAGDDNNDFTMLEEADIKIVMPSAPKKLLAIADIIAPPANDMGILTVLRQVCD
ncbi:MAG: HAD family phosphatase [Simkaniaceae bacterium]|nr:HAD family phosphatase [Simkaniaceae bacterium]